MQTVKTYLLNLKRFYRQCYRSIAKPFNERWMFGQFIPIQAVNRSALEYDLTHFGKDEFHIPSNGKDHGLDGSRELALHYQPVALPRPYHFVLQDAVINAYDIIDPRNPDRVFLETFPEVSQFVEVSNHWVDRRKRRRVAKQAQTAAFDYDKAYWFPSRSDQNYYHFLIDCCLRYVDMPQQGVITPDTKMLFYSAPTGWQRKYLEILGITDDQIVVCGTKTVKVRNLILASSRRQRFAISRDAINTFTDLVRSKLSIDTSDTPKRFFISRSLTLTRRIENEPELAEALKPFGFEVVLLEKMSPEEQIALFSEAECIIAPHGAALTNLIYAKNAPRVVELIPGDFWGWGYFIQLTHTMGGQHRAVVGQTAHAASDDFSVDIEAIVAAVSDLPS